MTNQIERKATLRINHDNYTELQFVEVSHQAVDELIAHLIEMLEEHIPDQPLRIFVNSGELRQAQSIAYLLGQMRRYKKHFVVPYRVRVAVNFNMMLIASLVELFVQSLPDHTIQFKAFPVNDVDAAVEWLVDENDLPKP